MYKFINNFHLFLPVSGLPLPQFGFAHFSLPPTDMIANSEKERMETRKIIVIKCELWTVPSMFLLLDYYETKETHFLSYMVQSYEFSVVIPYFRR